MLSFHNKSINLGEILPRSTSRCSTDRVKALFQESRDLYRLHNKILSQGQTVNIARETPETPELEMHITKLRVEFPKRVSNATEGTQIDDSLILGDDKDTLEMPRIESPSVFLKKWANPTVYREKRKPLSLLERHSPISLLDVTFELPKTRKYKLKKTQIPKRILNDNFYKTKLPTYKKDSSFSQSEDWRSKSPAFFKDAIQKAAKMPKRPDSVNSGNKNFSEKLKKRFSIYTEKIY